MKSVRIASTVKHIEEGDERVTLFRIQEILSEHRSTLVMGILSDLPTYLQFKFYTKVDIEMQRILKDKLFELSNSKVSLDRYLNIVHEIEKNSNFRVPSQEFFREIDSVLDQVLNPTQLKLTR
ncbi:hypothetical protein [Chryseolinea sp. H1M3-3]|uniref:hypothetical protein n=1 Tax=Chryseolinea sp. H1M3-3 TaxID=3034144 RepID=UPI0023ED5CCE|nr:hypothetical protein [Chryseolinea sp. H1M3-3]